MPSETRCPPLPRRFAVVAGCALALSPAGMADEVRLMNGGRLSGDVLSIQEGGAIRLESPLAAQPLSLKGDAVRQIEFDRTAAAPATGKTRFVFANNDFLIGTLLGYSRESGASIHADDIGELNIPARHLRSISLDTQPVQTIYNGPDELANWTSDDRRRNQNWQHTGGQLSVDGTGQIGRMLELPERYVIHITLNWQGQPNFQLSFSDPLEEPEVRVDRYYLQFGRAGLEIKRETSSGRRYHTVGTLNRTPDQFPNREMQVELRVDRVESVIHLAINGKPEGRFMDPFDSPPTASGISLVSNASAGNQINISNLRVESWHRKPTSPPEQGDIPVGSDDSLMMREGDHYSGDLQSIRPVDGGLLFTMKVNFREEPMEILGDDVSMVRFAATDNEDPEAASPPGPGLLLQLQDRGRLSVERSSFEDDRVRVTHPLLGELILSRAGVSALERRIIDEKNDAK